MILNEVKRSSSVNLKRSGVGVDGMDGMDEMQASPVRSHSDCHHVPPPAATEYKACVLGRTA